MNSNSSGDAFARYRNRLIGSTALALACVAGFSAGPATAQDDGAADEASSDIELIVVRGTKRERQLQDVDDSISVTTGEDIVDRNIVDLNDLLTRVANADSPIAIRNLTPAAPASVDSGAAPSVSVYIDNVRTTSLDGPGFASRNIWDIEQVEVFRGPQSTRQGENSLGGAIIMRSVRPSHEFDARARAIFAEHGQRTASVAVGGSLIGDVLAARASFDYQTTDGFISAPTIGIDNFDARDAYTGRVSLLLAPESVPQFDALLTLSGAWRDGTGSFGLVDNDDDPFDYIATQSVTLEGFQDETNYAASLEMNYDLSDSLTVTSVTGYSDNTVERITQDNGFQEFSDTYFTQELRGQFEVGDFAGIFGVYYSNQKERLDADTPADDNFLGRNIPTAFLAPLLIGAGVAVDPAVFAFYPSIIAFESLQNVEIDRQKYAAFGEVDWQALERLTLTFGLRVDREENTTTTSGMFGIQNIGDFPDPFSLDPSLTTSAFFVNTILPALFTAGGTGGLTDDQSETVVLPRAGIRYDWTPDISTAFTASKGYRSGGVSIRNLGAAAVPFGPEKLWNYELSFRSLWFDDRLRFNVNAFYIDWKDQQVQVQFTPSPFDTAIVNAASSNVVGFEIESQFELGDYFNGYVSIGYAKTEFDEFMDGCPVGDCGGNEFENAPPWSGAIGGIFRHPIGAFAQADVSYRNAAFGSVANNPGGANFEERIVLDAQIGYEAERWKISMFGRNLTNEQVLVSSVTAFITQPIAPRVFGVRLDIRT